MKRAFYYITLFICFFVFTKNLNAYYEAPVDIIDMTIEELQQAVDDGLLTYELITRLYVDRINAYDKSYNSIRAINKNAIEEAKKLDIEYKEKGRRSLLHGIPIIIKDNIDFVGIATTGGARALLDSTPRQNAEVVDNLIKKGAIILAKSNMSEFAFSAKESNSSFGKVKNAYNINYSPYGSSGGTAVSIALQFAPLGLGTDTNSSIRIPASAASLVGMRGTHGLISTKGILPYDYSRDVVGPITKTVYDNALLLDLLNGNDGSKYTSSLNEENFKNKKIGIADDSLTDAYSEIKKLFNKKISLLENNDITVKHVPSFFNSTTKGYYYNTIGGWTFCIKFNDYIRNSSSKIRSFDELARSSGRIYNINNYLEDCTRDFTKFPSEVIDNRDAFQKYIKNIFDRYDIDALIYVTSQNKLSTLSSPKVTDLSSFTAPPSALPSINIPLGFDKDNLPYGIEIFGFDETTLYEISYGIESLKYEYYLPKKVPSLYKVPENINQLLEIRKEEIDEKRYKAETLINYKKANEDIEEFITNYNEYENKTAKIDILIENYLAAKDGLVEIALKTFILDNWMIVLPTLVIICLVLVFKKKRKNKKRKAKNDIYA